MQYIKLNLKKRNIFNSKFKMVLFKALKVINENIIKSFIGIYFVIDYLKVLLEKFF